MTNESMNWKPHVCEMLMSSMAGVPKRYLQDQRDPITIINKKGPNAPGREFSTEQYLEC
jgi:hypothetical protein